MKIRKFNETLSDKESQKSEIIEVFLDMIDDDLIYYDKDDDFEKHMIFYHNMDDLVEVCSTFEELDENLETYKKIADYLDSLKTPLNRLLDEGFEWNVETNLPEVYITVYFKDVEYNLKNAFIDKGHITINTSIFKKVLERDYGIKYKSYTHHPSTSGYYGNRAYYSIVVHGSIEDNIWEKLKRDIMDIKKETYQAFNSVTRNEYGTRTTIKIQFY